jgi:hypothetical protein
VAVDAIGFGPGDLDLNHGVWPVRTPDGPGLLVAGAARLAQGSVQRVRGRVRVFSGAAELAWSEGAGAAWSGGAGGCALECAFDLAAPEDPARLVLRADHAVVSKLDVVAAP